jgi:tRNA dimethylallyltransferase
MKNKPKIIVVLGPTATGKSDLAVQLALKFNGEVVSADSRQVYKDLDLGSGKITEEEMKGVPHYLLDVADPNTEIFSVADFQKLAYEKIDDILSRGKVPIVCGGTAFYIQSIVDGIVLPDITANPKLRKKLESWSLEKLQKKLKKLDPERYSEIDEQNPVRLIRAIEIAKQFGKVPKLKSNPKYECLQIGLKLPEEELQQKIALRLEKRMFAGMLDEGKSLHEKGLSFQRMEALGLEYRFMAEHLQGKISLEEMLEQIRIKSRQFAKRQMTWFKKDKRIEWFEPLKNETEISNLIGKFLK